MGFLIKIICLQTSKLHRYFNESTKSCNKLSTQSKANPNLFLMAYVWVAKSL